MIGVVAHSGEYEPAREFFELFKTPWEWYRPEGQYEVVLIARGDVSARDYKAKILVLYSRQETRIDEELSIKVVAHQQQTMLSFKGSRLPLYGGSCAFVAVGESFLQDANSYQTVGVLFGNGGHIVARMGYDLFQEMRTLLTEGQPTEHAGIPTVEKHIEILRDLIIDAGVTLIEIPPIPDGYRFIACLTHDVDHPFMRRHRWDHTMFGFLYRAVFGSLLRVLARKMPLRHLLTNWAAAAKSPLMYWGLTEDPWYGFDRYLEIERGAKSTFFVLPFKDDPGQTTQGRAPRRRASGYGAADLGDRVRALMDQGSEVGLHGLDAWLDSSKGIQERDEVARMTGKPCAGVRMHWLYFAADSPGKIEQAGFSFDSTVGYNHAIGFRAGTTQVFKLIGATALLELPLHIMDTALFFPNYLNLNYTEAEKRIGDMIDHVCKFGGVLTINWHDRSIAPERLWGDFYARLVDKLTEKGAWCTSAGCAVTWFKKRRSAVFQGIDQGMEVRLSDAAIDMEVGTPPLKVRVYNPHGPDERATTSYFDTALTSSTRCFLPAVISRTCC